MRLLTTTVLFLILNILKAQPLKTEQMDQLVARTMKAFDVPGIAVGIVENSNLFLPKVMGYARYARVKKWMKIHCLV